MKKGLPFIIGSCVAAYFRDSGGEEQELSIARQEAEFNRWCSENGLIPGSIFKDEGRPGSSVASRLGFQEMMRHFRSGQAQEVGLVIWNYQRFARDIDDSQFFRADLRRRGYIIHSLNDDIPEGPMGRFIEAALDWKNEQFLIDLSADVRSGLRELVARYGAVPGTPPRGFKREPVQISSYRNDQPRLAHRWVPDPETAPQVRKAFEMLLTGASLAEIQAATRLYRGVNSFVTFFKNPIYKGVLEYADLVIEDYCEPIVDPETWDQVQAFLAKRARRQHMSEDNSQHPRRIGSVYLLSGLAYCARCGSPLSGLSAKQANGTYNERYICSRRKRNHDCDAEAIPRLFLDELIIRAVTEQLLKPETLQACQDFLLRDEDQRLAELDRQRSELRGRLGAARRKIANIADSLAEEGRSRALLNKLVELEAEEAGLLAELAKLDNLASAKVEPLSENQLQQQIDWLAQELHNENPAVVKQTLKGIVSRVIIEREDKNVRVQVEYFFPPLDAKPPPDEYVSINPAPLGAPTRIELLDLSVEQFCALIHFEKPDRLTNCIKFTQGIQELSYLSHLKIAFFGNIR